MNVTVEIRTGDKTLRIPASVGESILDVLGRASLAGDVHTPCGGRGSCGKCTVMARGHLSPVSDGESRHLTEDQREAGLRLACLARVEGDCTVTLLRPGESGKMEVNAQDKLAQADPLSFTVRAVIASVSCPTAEDPRPADENLLSALRAAGEKAMYVTEDAAAAAAALVDCGKTELYCALREDGTVLSVFGEERQLYGLAVDIGTTTVAAALICLSGRRAGARVAVRSCANPQKFAGADVIARVSYCMENEDGLARQADVIRQCLSGMAGEMLSEAGAEPAQLLCGALAGNTVMEHLALGMDARSIARAPFAAASLMGRQVSPEKLGLQGQMADGARVYVCPCVASYIGGDITAGAAVAVDESASDGRAVLFLDIGTNGEIGLAKNGTFTFCAAAAGPALEGAHMDCGMPSMPGAVKEVKLLPDGSVQLSNIGDAEPRGLCGTGIIDAVAEMLRVGVLEEDGSFAWEMPEAFAHRYDEDEERFYLFGDVGEEDGVYISAADVRQVQLARAAIAAGVRILMKRTDTAEGDVAEVILAGGLGNGILPHSACAIGLVPASLEEKIRAAGNTSLSGAQQYLTSARMRERIGGLRDASRYIELSCDGDFTALFVEEMTF